MRPIVPRIAAGKPIATFRFDGGVGAFFAGAAAEALIMSAHEPGNGPQF